MVWNLSRAGAAVLASTLAAPALAAGPEVGTEQAFRDWTAACDNFLSCVAIGTQADGGAGGYVVLRRDAGAEAPVQVEIVAISQDGPAGDAALAVSARGLAARTYPAARDGDYLTAAVPEADTAALVAAMLAGTDLALSVVGDASADAGPVSLRGATAALLWIDDRQGRVGTASALVRLGSAPAATPALPEGIPINRVAITALDPVPPRPAGLSADAEGSCADLPDLAFALGGGATLWGLCDFAAAYNTGYRFWVVEASGSHPATFVIPGVDGDPAVLVNPSLNPDGSLGALNLGRGLGDCGDGQDWAWTGEAFALLDWRRLDACAGVARDDWPYLYRARP
ncbi:MAG: hypothetical protein DI556_17670 [Rhodovulum sulfidophilum]|uniref:DUF1176 domain-containing protein n=1 Tax=Rhodovulum sulfidophilum TaxID=35806 RepID=A0A2W5N1B4_RHOSU|nr:MAG: hypothetical protein DI556_17670 [Rhodovulum sulfidophilum]